MLQHLDAAIPRATRVADGALKPRHDFDVVREHVGGTVTHDGLDIAEHALEVAEQSLDEQVRRVMTDALERLGDVRRASVENVVAIDHGDDHVGQIHLAERASDVLRFARVDEALGVAGVDRAETTTARAGLAEDHDRGGALRPALEHVGTAGFLTDRVQVELPHLLFDAEQLLLSLLVGETYAEPARFAGGKSHEDYVEPGDATCKERCASPP